MINGMYCKRGWLSMEINRDGRAGQTMLPGQSEHRLTEGRQGRWLYELEQALLLKSEKKPVTAAPERAAVSEQAATPELGAGGNRGDTMAAASGGHGACAQLPAAATAAAATAKAEVDVDEAGAASPVASAKLGAALAGGPAAAALAMAVDQPGTMTTAPAPALSLAAYAAAGATSQRPASEAVVGGIQPAQESKPAMMAALHWSAQAGAESALSAESAESAAPEEEAAPASAPPEREPVDDYAARLLHVYQGADGVQAWVRDAGIGAAQSLLLARGMADELNNAGSRLSELTVNGKKIVSDGDSRPINSKGAM